MNSDETPLKLPISGSHQNIKEEPADDTDPEGKLPISFFFPLRLLLHFIISSFAAVLIFWEGVMEM